MRFRSDPAQIRGSIAPVVTPFAEDGSLDLDSTRRLVEWQLESGSHGISIGGSTGEPSALTPAEREAVMAAAAAEIADRVPFVPGSGSTHLEETLELTAAAERLGADAVLLITPYYSRPTQEGLFQWYATVAREFPDLPIIIYNVPIRTAVDVHPQTVGRLRRAHANIVGIKETTKDFEHCSYVFNECGLDFLVYCGIELLCYPMLALGGVGIVSAAANLAPAALAEMYESFTAGDWERSRDLHYQLHPLVDLIFLETNPGPMKWAMRELGLIPSAHVRPPLASPSEATRERIRAILDAYPSLERPGAVTRS
jgi:4-hydroxy-tetrahydrodipicolinate synthase